LDNYILCDIGNTTYSFLIDNKIKKFALDEEILIEKDNKIYFISVNKQAVNKLKQNFKNTIDLAPFFKIKSNYCLKLGIDRIALIYGIKDAIVVDFGSAITIDVVKSGNHLGGYILPGLQTLKNIYPKISPKLNFEFSISKDLPTCTNEAISNAILDMITLPILNLKEKYNLPLIFSGGDGEYFAKKLNAIYDENLIFKHMKEVIKQNLDKIIISDW